MKLTNFEEREKENECLYLGPRGLRWTFCPDGNDEARGDAQLVERENKKRRRVIEMRERRRREGCTRKRYDEGFLLQ